MSKYILAIIILCVVGLGVYLMKDYFIEEPLSEKLPEEVSEEKEEPEEQILEGETMDQLTADLKGEGKQQLINLLAVKDKEYEFVFHGLVRIFKDEKGKTLEWEGPLVEGIHSAGGTLSVATNSATNWTTIQATWGAGAHGAISQFIHWTGSKFEIIKAIDENGEEIDSFFGDGGGAVLNPDGTISVYFRNYDCPLSGQGITYTYEWNGNVYQYAKTEAPPCPSE